MCLIAVLHMTIDGYPLRVNIESLFWFYPAVYRNTMSLSRFLPLACWPSLRSNHQRDRSQSRVAKACVRNTNYQLLFWWNLNYYQTLK